MLTLQFPSRVLDNLFFRNERNKIVLEQEGKADEAQSRRKIQAHVGFENLAKIVSKRWHNIDPAYKEELEKEAKLDKERYRKEMAAWKLKALDEEEEVIDLEEDDDDDTSKQEGLQMTLSSNQGFRWGGGVQYFSLQHSSSSSRSNQSILNQSFTPNNVRAMPAMDNASSSSIMPRPKASTFNPTFMSFGVEMNPQRGHPFGMLQGSLHFPNNVPTQSFQFEGRSRSMPYSLGSADRMVNFGFDTANQQNRCASLFASLRETASDDTQQNNFPPIDEIKRFFNINPKTGKVENPMFYCGSCMD
jgi:hypothetical protein